MILPPRSDASGRPLRSWKAPRTRSLERLRYVAHAFLRAGSGGFPAARGWYYQDAPDRVFRVRSRLERGQGCPRSCFLVSCAHPDEVVTLLREESDARRF